MIKTITLATLEEATPSEVFNFIAHHLLTQFEQSVITSGTNIGALGIAGQEFACRYRKGNLSCAAGCLMSVGEYESDFEGFGWMDLVEGHRAPGKHRNLITGMQRIHDTRQAYKNPGVWLPLLLELVEEHGFDLEPEVQALIDLRSTK